MNNNKYNPVKKDCLKGYLLINIKKLYLKIIIKELITHNIISYNDLDSILNTKDIDKINKIIETEINKDIGKIIIDLALN